MSHPIGMLITRDDGSRALLSEDTLRDMDDLYERGVYLAIAMYANGTYVHELSKLDSTMCANGAAFRVLVRLVNNGLVWARPTPEGVLYKTMGLEVV
jgi:hypothetical protein